MSFQDQPDSPEPLPTFPSSDTPLQSFTKLSYPADIYHPQNQSQLFLSATEEGNRLLFMPPPDAQQSAGFFDLGLTMDDKLFPPDEHQNLFLSFSDHEQPVFKKPKTESKELPPRTRTRSSVSSDTHESSNTSPERKKRAYFRKDKYPKEFLDKVAEERLKRKREKNRELAAKSRQKRKHKLAFVSSQNQRLKGQLDECQRIMCQTCSAQVPYFDAADYPDSPPEDN